MKVALNLCFGGFAIPDELCEILNCGTFDYNKRNDPRLVKYIEEHGNDEIGIAEIPDSTTDWMITEYDDYETCYYVLHGKIKVAKSYTIDNNGVKDYRVG